MNMRKEDIRVPLGAAFVFGLTISLSACVNFPAPQGVSTSPESAVPSAPISSAPTSPPSSDPNIAEEPIDVSSSATESTQTSAASTPSELGWPDVIETARTGVAHLLINRCDDTVSGSGFLIADDLVVTAAHVVKDAAEVTIRVGDQLVGGEVLGTNDLSEIALVRTNRDVAGYQFPFIEGEPRIGTDVRALGFPRNQLVKDQEASNNGFSANEGDVTALNQSVEFDIGVIENLIRTDASVDSGNSGGPLITQNGEVVGLISNGEFTFDGAPVNGWAYAVTAPRIATAVEEWKERSNIVAKKLCANAPAPIGTVLESSVTSSHDQAMNIAHSLVAHGQAINLGNYESAFSIFTGRLLKENINPSVWSEGIRTSYWVKLVVQDVEGTGDSLKTRVGLTTIQDPEFSPAGTTGQECSVWTLDYSMRWDGSRWLMADVRKIGDTVDCTDDWVHDDSMYVDEEFGG